MRHYLKVIMLTVFFTGGALAASSTTGKITVTGKVIAGTCDFSGPSAIAVPLGDVSFNDFSGVGTTTAAKDFTIQLKCQDEANVYLTMAASEESNLGSSGVLALQGAGTATGVGIQLLKDGSPFPLNSRTEIALNQSADLNINMGARYYQSSASMTAGSGNAVVNFTVDYL